MFNTLLEVGMGSEVGALVEVTFKGRVHASEPGGGFWVTVGEGLNQRVLLVPPGVTYIVKEPPRPREVLLLDCGHLSDMPRPSSPSSRLYCLRCCESRTVDRVGSVTW